MLNMNVIFEHWTVTLLSCFLVDKTWKSNLLSWACLRIYGAERQATSFYLSPIPACFEGNEMEGEEQGREDTHPHTGTGTHTHTRAHTQPKGIVVFPFPLHCIPAPYCRGTLPTITLVSKRRNRANIRAFPELSGKLSTLSSQRTDTPALLSSWQAPYWRVQGPVLWIESITSMFWEKGLCLESVWMPGPLGWEMTVKLWQMRYDN